MDKKELIELCKTKHLLVECKNEKRYYLTKDALLFSIVGKTIEYMFDYYDDLTCKCDKEYNMIKIYECDVSPLEDVCTIDLIWDRNNDKNLPVEVKNSKLVEILLEKIKNNEANGSINSTGIEIILEEYLEMYKFIKNQIK